MAVIMAGSDRGTIEDDGYAKDLNQFPIDNLNKYVYFYLLSNTQK